MTIRVRLAGVIWSVVALPALLACTATGGSSPSSADCGVLIMYDGATYESVAFLHPGPSPVVSGGLEAEITACNDTGDSDHPRGAYFPDDPDTISVDTFAGIDPADAIAWAEDGVRAFTQVYVNRELTDLERRAILARIDPGGAPS